MRFDKHMFRSGQTLLLCVSSEEFAARTPSEVGDLLFGIFCSFEFSRDRHSHGTRKCPHRLSSDKLLRVAVPSQLRVSLHAWRLPRRNKNASTHVENLSQSDKTDIANALFNMDTKLGACQSPHVLPSLANVCGFAGVPCFRIFRTRGRDGFFLCGMYSRSAPIAFETL